MKRSCISITLLMTLTFVASSCQFNKGIPNKEVKKDTLNLGYMYWSNDFTPFGFGSRYSLIVLGTVSEINTPLEVKEDLLYNPVKGVVAIQEVILDSKSHNRDMAKIGHIETDCYDGTSLVPGDQVLIFSVSYEGDYAITGRQSIIKIPPNNKQHYITSLKKYINASFNPTVIESDIDLWSKTTQGEALKNYIKEYRDFQQN